MLFSSKIYLKNVRFHAYHGVLPQETQVGNDYVVNLEVKYDFSSAMETMNWLEPSTMQNSMNS